jgi:hypothetical protein
VRFYDVTAHTPAPPSSPAAPSGSPLPPETKQETVLSPPPERSLFLKSRSGGLRSAMPMESHWVESIASHSPHMGRAIRRSPLLVKSLRSTLLPFDVRCWACDVFSRLTTKKVALPQAVPPLKTNLSKKLSGDGGSQDPELRLLRAGRKKAQERPVR